MDPIPASHWLSLGHSQSYDDAMCVLQLQLVRVIEQIVVFSELRTEVNQLVSTLASLGDPVPVEDLLSVDPNIAIGIPTQSLREIEGNLILQDDALLPLWERFAEALDSLVPHKDCFKLTLSIVNVELAKHSLDAILSSLEDLDVGLLLMRNNRLGCDGIQTLTRFLERHTTLSSFCLVKNELECEVTAHSLVEATSRHPHLTALMLSESGIDQRYSIMRAIAPSLLTRMHVKLDNNGLGHQGADLISKLLATNPKTAALSLDGNQFDDNDAILLSNSLRANTSLGILSLRDNNFTSLGINRLFKSIYNDDSLGGVYHSNVTCNLMLFNDTDLVPDWADLSALSLNSVAFNQNVLRSLMIAKVAGDDPMFDTDKFVTDCRRKIKVLHALQGQNQFNTSYISSALTKIIPMLLDFIQTSGTLYSGIEEVAGSIASPRDLPLTQFGNLDRLFQLVRSKPDIVAFRHMHP